VATGDTRSDAICGRPRLGSRWCLTLLTGHPATHHAAHVGLTCTCLLKSGPGGGGVLAPPPQLARTAKAESVHASFVICNMRTLRKCAGRLPIATHRCWSLNRKRRGRGMLCRSRCTRDRYGVGRRARPAAPTTSRLEHHSAEQYASQ